jgi:PAS domain S-box-containing protein
MGRSMSGSRRPRAVSYEQLVDAMNDAAFVVSEDGKLLDVNARAAEILGFSKTELLKSRREAVEIFLSQDKADAIVARIIAGERPTVETRLRSKDGTVIPVEVSSSRVAYQGLPAILAVAREITERRRLEEALLELTTRNQAILQTVPDIIAEIDANHVYTWMNRAGLDFFGDGAIGTAASSYFDGVQDTCAAVGPLFDGKVETYHLESWQRRRDGERRLLTWWCRALKDQDGTVTGVLTSARDITEIRQAEMMMSARLRLLELANNATVEALLQRTLDELEALTASTASFCNFLDPDESMIEAAAWSTRTLGDFCKADREGLHLPVTQAGVWADCIRQRRPMIHNDYLALSRRRGTPPGHGPLVRFASVPVFRDERIVAIFAVGNKPAPYTEKDVEVVSSFADLAWDIAARKHAEAALLESDARNRRMLDASPDAVFLSDAAGNFLDCNQTAVDRYGYSRDELLSMTYRDMAALDLRERAGERLPNTLAKGGTVFEWRHRRKDGTEFPVEIRTAPFAAHGEQRILATVRDLTEAKRAEEALRQSESEFRVLFEGAPVGIGVADLQGKILAFNEAMLGPGGYRADDIGKIGNVAALYYDPADRERALEIFRDQGRLVQFETRFKRKDGTPYDVSLSLTQTTFAGTRCILAIHEDRTEQMRAEEALRRSEQQLRQSQKMESMGRLAGGVAHDFNNLLGVILGHAELAMEQLDPEQPAFDSLLEIRNAAERSASITQQLLAFARRQVTTPLLLDINRSIDGVVDILRRLVGEDVELLWLPGTGLGTVEIDPSQLDQILVNLCANCRDAIADSGEVIVETSAVSVDQSFCDAHEGCVPGEYVVLSVSDNGCGIPREVLDHLFEPFFTTKEPGKGTGLGLSTVYGIVRQNHGAIDIAGQPPPGTTVRIYLPKRSEQPSPPAQAPTVKVSAGTGQTLLVVEDEPSVLRLTERILSGLHYRVISARTPLEALHAAEAHQGQIDLLVTDVIMPEMNGRELAESLLALRPGLKVLYVSGYAAEVISGRGLLDSGTTLLQKPFTPEELGTSVSAALSR